MTGLRRFIGAEDGVSATEFALFAPVLFFALLAMIDIALAVHERMEIDRLLRNGAQSAMEDPGASTVQTVIEASAEDQFAAGTDFALTVERYCACPETAETSVTCSTSCADGPAAIYYRMNGTRTHQGMILPDIDLDATAQVRIR